MEEHLRINHKNKKPKVEESITIYHSLGVGIQGGDGIEPEKRENVKL